MAAAAAFQQKVNSPIDVARDQTYGSFNYVADRHTIRLLLLGGSAPEREVLEFTNFVFRYLKQDRLPWQKSDILTHQRPGGGRTLSLSNFLRLKSQRKRLLDLKNATLN